MARMLNEAVTRPAGIVTICWTSASVVSLVARLTVSETLRSARLGRVTVAALAAIPPASEKVVGETESAL